MTLSIQELSDRIAIRELADRYTVGVTCRDWAAVASCFHENAHWSVPGVSVAFQGQEAIAAGIRSAVEPNAFHMLMPHAFVIDTLGDARATARSILHEVFQRPDNQEGAHVLGVYNDVVTKLEGVWRFETRRFDIYLMDGSGCPGQVMVDYASLGVT